MRIAALDIGTNTLLMTVAEVDAHGGITILADEHEIVRLGESLTTGGFINDAAVDRARACLGRYDQLCRALNVDVRVGVATSAARRAMNGTEVIRQLAQEMRASFNIIDGNEEARLSFLGTAARDVDTAVVDIGGGSTEIVCGRNNDVHTRHSLELGAVRITEEFFTTLPPSTHAIQQATEFIRAQLRLSTPLDVRYLVVGVAGTPTTLAAMSRRLSTYNADSIEGAFLDASFITETVRVLMTHSLENIRSIPGVHPLRADILPAGSLILREILAYHQRNEIMVSTRGLRYGVLQAAIDAIARRAVARP